MMYFPVMQMYCKLELYSTEEAVSEEAEEDVLI